MAKRPQYRWQVVNSFKGSQNFHAELFTRRRIDRNAPYYQWKHVRNLSDAYGDPALARKEAKPPKTAVESDPMSDGLIQDGDFALELSDILRPDEEALVRLGNHHNIAVICTQIRGRNNVMMGLAQKTGRSWEFTRRLPSIAAKYVPRFQTAIVGFGMMWMRVRRMPVKRGRPIDIMERITA
jgi:hypothetical protein